MKENRFSSSGQNRSGESVKKQRGKRKWKKREERRRTNKMKQLPQDQMDILEEEWGKEEDEWINKQN